MPIQRPTSWALLLAALFALPAHASGQQPLINREGVRLAPSATESDPVLTATMPAEPTEKAAILPPPARSFSILVPEHVTVRAAGQQDAVHLYVYAPGVHTTATVWRRRGHTLTYTREFSGIRFQASATLEPDGILFRYRFANHTPVSYSMATAITDPRFRVFFYDPRLQRTFVHFTDGWAPLAAETPARLSEPLQSWLPARYHAQFTAPVPAERVQHRADGITYYYNSRRVDLPVIATVSQDGSWVAASFARSPGNVWSNPELTCQHVDPEVPLPAGATASYQVKLLLVHGGLDEVLRKVREQQPQLADSSSSPR